MIAIIDYNTGNLRSVENILKRIGSEYVITSDAAVIASADRVLLPGVGAAGAAMQRLNERGLCEVIRSLTAPTLGICLGMQLMCSYSEEDDTECLGIFSNKIMKIKPKDDIKIPHVGWNQIYNLKSSLYEGISEREYVYFVHSYAANMNENVIATSFHGEEFGASLGRDNFYGCQFHPEKSGDIGEQIIRNFVHFF
ncbi:MAG: imidazole glycerol phosphate synthase subunit HisH [Rikenellaceae bacterium]